MATAVIALGLEAGQLFLHSRGADMAMVLIPVISGVAGALLYRPFVTTFVRGAGASRRDGEDWQGT